MSSGGSVKVGEIAFISSHCNNYHRLREEYFFIAVATSWEVVVHTVDVIALSWNLCIVRLGLLHELGGAVILSSKEIFAVHEVVSQKRRRSNPSFLSHKSSLKAFISFKIVAAQSDCSSLRSRGWKCSFVPGSGWNLRKGMSGDSYFTGGLMIPLFHVFLEV